jgi:hypothetical protein
LVSSIRCLRNMCTWLLNLFYSSLISFRFSFTLAGPNTCDFHWFPSCAAGQCVLQKVRLHTQSKQFLPSNTKFSSLVVRLRRVSSTVSSRLSTCFRPFFFGTFWRDCTGCMYIYEGLVIRSGPCTATFSDLLCLIALLTDRYIQLCHWN